MRPHCFILSEACSYRLDLAYFAIEISKNRLFCKSAFALAYYGLLAMPTSCAACWEINIVYILIGINYKTAGNSPGSSLYEDYTFVMREGFHGLFCTESKLS